MGRREYKYLVDDRAAEQIRRSIAGFCVPDKHAPSGRYLCDTLYLDTLAFDIYRATVENARVRQKLRIRSYPRASGAPVFLEVKRRVDDVIVKHRTPLPASEWASILETAELERVPADAREAAEPFFASYLGSRQGPIVPQLIVRYEREPYSSVVDDYARVTFDRRIETRAASDLAFEDTEHGWTPVDHPLAMHANQPGSLSVLELKFSGPPPPWMRQLVQQLELPRLAFSKYARSVEALHLAPSLRASQWA